jgi:SsrA-binding protein
MDKIMGKNTRAYFDYTIHDTYEVGVELLGWEVKSLRLYGVSLKSSFCLIRNGEMFWAQTNLKNPLAHMQNHHSDRMRKLLLHKNQINRIRGVLSDRHHSIIPLECYFKNRRYFKLVIGICKKNKEHDKREKIKKREMNRNINNEIY